MSSESPSIDFGSMFPSQPSGRARAPKRKRAEAMEVVSQPSQTIRTITRFPLSKKRRYPAIHAFKRTYDAGNTIVTSDAIAPTYVGLNFSMNDMPGYTELTSLYDFYKLSGVRVKVIPYLQNMSNSTASLNNLQNAPIFYAVDRSDATAPASIGEVLEYNDHKIGNTWSGFQIYIPNPKFSDATSAVRGGWVATSNPSLNWFGLKIAIPPTGVAGRYYTVITYYVKCKDPK